MKKTIKYTACLAVLLVAAAQVQAGGNAVAGKWKAQTCLGCHGVLTYTNVYPTYYVPYLGGQHADYIAAALNAYKNGERSHETMTAQAHRLSEQDIADVAAYFASFGSAPPVPDAQVPLAIENLVVTCSACHGNDGNSQITLYPKIAGQRADYLYQSLLSYKDGRRTNLIMKGIVVTLTESDMRVLAQHFASHPGLSGIELSPVSTGPENSRE